MFSLLARDSNLHQLKRINRLFSNPLNRQLLQNRSNSPLVYGVIQELNILQSIADDFTAKNPNVKVTVNVSDWDTYWDKLQTTMAYPNPFNPSTEIRYSVDPRAGHVALKIYNVLGAEVTSLVNEQKEAGAFSVHWNVGGLPSGTYVYRMAVTSENGILFDQTKKMMLIK